MSRHDRYDALTEALRIIADVVGDSDPSPQVLEVTRAIKRLRDQQPGRLASFSRVDYLERVQLAAQAAWNASHGGSAFGPQHDATATVETPLGPLTATVWREWWKGRRGERLAWRSDYSLAGEPITIRDIRDAGLAQRPTSRNRQKKEPTT